MINGPLFSGARIGPHAALPTLVGNGGANGFTMSALNAGWCARWVASDARDVASVWINWGTVTSPGTVELRIETIDTTTLQPTGTLYDASATKSFTPSVGWQNVIFNTLPTAGLTPGTMYGALLITTTAGTNHSLRSHVGTNSVQPHMPHNYLSGLNANTRTNLTEGGGYPIITWMMEDGVEEVYGGLPFATSASFGVYGTRAAAAKLVLAGPMKFDGIYCTNSSVQNIVNLTGDFRLQILTAAGAAVSGADVTVTRKLWKADFQSRNVYAPFGAPVTLPAGTYYVVVRNTDTGSISSAGFSVTYGVCRSADVNSSGLILSTTTDVTAGTIVWTDDATANPGIGLQISDTVSGGAGTVYVPIPGRVRPRVTERARRLTRVLVLPGTNTVTTAYVPIKAPARQVRTPAPRARPRVLVLPGTSTVVTNVLPIKAPARQVRPAVVRVRPRALVLPGTNTVDTVYVPTRPAPRIRVTTRVQPVRRVFPFGAVAPGAPTVVVFKKQNVVR